METKSALTFSWKQFWETFIYENLPPVLFSPIAALLIEKSAMRDSHYLEMMNRLIDYSTFHDLTHSPTGLLGTIADNKLVTSVLGALITGCLLALQGFVNLEIAYDIAGWSIP